MSADKPFYLELVDHYENCFVEHGATPKGVDWPNPQDLQTRFKVMLSGMPFGASRLLDVGCGYGALLQYIQQKQSTVPISYHGIDLSEKMIAHAKEQYPEASFEIRNLLPDPLPENSYDFAILNGVFTEKRGLSQQQMEDFFINLVLSCYRSCRFGIAFNVMNHHVDWYRDDLFYMPFDRMATLLKQHCSRHFRLNADYGLYEYTVYLYKQPLSYD